MPQGCFWACTSKRRWSWPSDMGCAQPRHPFPTRQVRQALNPFPNACSTAKRSVFVKPKSNNPRFRSWGARRRARAARASATKVGHDLPAIILFRRYDGGISRVLEHELPTSVFGLIRIPRFPLRPIRPPASAAAEALRAWPRRTKSRCAFDAEDPQNVIEPRQSEQKCWVFSAPV